MCTVSIAPTERGVRLVCNRDERLSRAAATPPREHRIGSRRAVYPVDPSSGGTWIGVNDAGLAAVLLNRNDTPSGSTPRGGASSRGLIVPHLLGCRNLDEAWAQATALDDRLFEPFRVLLLQRGRLAVVTSRGGRLTADVSELSGPTMFTSSSLGDRLVDRPRRALFNRLLGSTRRIAVAQDVFHDHRWLARRDISVRMCRGGAATVSRTTIEIGAFDLQYEALC